MIIAIDGPAAAGKGTLARRIAQDFDFAYMDTGSLYRATAKKVLDQAIDPDDSQGCTVVALNLTPEDLHAEGLRTAMLLRPRRAEKQAPFWTVGTSVRWSAPMPM
jgi:cytidylate kinase